MANIHPPHRAFVEPFIHLGARAFGHAVHLFVSINVDFVIHVVKAVRRHLHLPHEGLGLRQVDAVVLVVGKDNDFVLPITLGHA